MKTPAVVFMAPGRTELQEIAMPDPREGEVQVQTLRSCVSCGTEGWVLQNLFTWQATPYPCVPGYQRVGVIRKIGPGVTGWQEGDRVFATIGRWQGTVAPAWGAHLAAGNTSASELYRIPAGVTDTDASAAVVAQVGYNAASRLTLAPGDWVMVYGDGIIGQCAAQAARARGARVILVGHRQERLDLARRHSADHAVDNRAGPVADVARTLTGGRPVAGVLDTVQTESAQREYLPLLAHGQGQVVYCGFTPGKAWADMGLLQQRELTTHFVSGWTRPRMEATLALLAERKLRLEPLVTHAPSFQQAPAMYALVLGRSAPFLGITLNWEGAQ
jgi:2-desacetyl-2-hydroxyethyl bacteriochlorophyllide A dehydrogenase